MDGPPVPGELRDDGSDTWTSHPIMGNSFYQDTQVDGGQTHRFVYLDWSMIGEYDQTAGKWLWQEVPPNRGEGMLAHVALDTNDLGSFASRVVKWVDKRSQRNQPAR